MSGTCCSTARRVRRSADWIAPTVVLVAMPKCPMCLAAYVAVATGVGISMTAATYLRAGLLIVSAAALVYVITRGIVKRFV